MKSRLWVVGMLIAMSLGVVWGVLRYHSFDDVQATMTISLPVPVYNPPKRETVYIQVPPGRYNEAFAEKLGEKKWKMARELYRKRVGLRRFMPGDVFEMTTIRGRVERFSLHHYANRTSGKEIVFVKKGRHFVKKERRVGLVVKNVVKYYKVKTSFRKDYPQFFETAKPRLLWDWGIMDMLEPGDSISFLLKGIFDGDILVHLYGILGLSVKSDYLGEFTLTLYRKGAYGDYFAADHSQFISPSGFFRTPIDYGRVSSPYGYRRDPFTHRRHFHNGVDIIARRGTPIHAAQDGKVIFSGRKGSFGKTLILEHKNGFRTLYGHCSALLVPIGTFVHMGDIVALVGNTGRSTASHLHFSVYKDGKTVNPMTFTYERSWAPPFDIGSDFRYSAMTKASWLLKSLKSEHGFFVEQTIAQKK